jgi:hypothetical protein
MQGLLELLELAIKELLGFLAEQEPQDLLAQPG